MARRRFFVSEVRRGLAEMTGEEAEHLVRVLRAETGQIYELSDNQDLYLARITSARKSLVSFEILERMEVPASSGHLTLVAALFKFDHFEWLVEKAVELGVDAIVPFEAVRTERGLMQASAKRRQRWERIALEASQQSRRVHLPVVDEAVRLDVALQNTAGVKLFLDEDAAAPPILRILAERNDGFDRVALLVGPEGGWTEEERIKAVQTGWLPCSLGGTILRAETAGIAGLAVIQAHKLSR